MAAKDAADCSGGDRGGLACGSGPADGRHGGVDGGGAETGVSGLYGVRHGDRSRLCGESAGRSPGRRAASSSPTWPGDLDRPHGSGSDGLRQSGLDRPRRRNRGRPGLRSSRGGHHSRGCCSHVAGRARRLGPVPGHSSWRSGAGSTDPRRSARLRRHGHASGRPPGRDGSGEHLVPGRSRSAGGRKCGTRPLWYASPANGTTN